MMRKSIFYLLFLSAVVFSCGDDDSADNTPLATDQAQISMDNLANDMSDDVVEIVQSDGVSALNELFILLDLNDPFQGRMSELDGEGRKKWLKSRMMLFKTIFIPTKSIDFARVQESGFDFEGNHGVYNWNADLEEFEKTQDVVETIIINFPSEGSETNNVSLNIKDYEEQLFVESDEFFTDEYYEPTLLIADVSVDGVVQVEVDFQVEYNEEASPLKANGTLFVNPYTFTLNFDDTGNASSLLDASIRKGNENKTSVSLSIDFMDAEKDEVEAVEGFVQYLSIKIEGDIDVLSLDTEENIDVNDYINLVVFDGNRKLGDIIIEEELDEFDYPVEIPYVLYEDGSKEKLEDILQPVVDQLEGEFDGWDFGD